MLTSFFSTSKPINFMVLTFSVVVFFVGYFIQNDLFTLSLSTVLSRVGVLLVYLFSLGVLNFVVTRNTLTRKNTYILFFFVCFTLAIPVCFSRPSVILAGLFILLALRRIISLKSELEIRKKIFDAAFWIIIASLFYFWSVLFLIVLYFAILFHGRLNYKNWMIPPVAVFIVLTLCLTYSLYTEGIAAFFDNYIVFPVFDFSAYSNLRLLLPVSFFLALYLWCVIKYIGLINAVSQKLKPSYILIIVSSLVSILMVLFSPVRDGSEVYFLYGPLAIIVSRYVEKSREFWFKEMILWLALLTPSLTIWFL